MTNGLLCRRWSLSIIKVGEGLTRWLGKQRCLLLRPGEDDPWNSGKGRREVTLGSCPLASIQVPQHVSPHDTHSTHAHTDDDDDDDDDHHHHHHLQ